MNIREILIDIHALEQEMMAFERKYGIRSETFYAAYVSGEEPEDESWVMDLVNGLAFIVHGLLDRRSIVTRFNVYKGIRKVSPG